MNINWKKWLQPRQSTIEIVQEIHNSFNGAADSALQEANRILGNSKPIESHIDTLEQLGFTNVKSVVQASRKRAQINLLKEQAELISHFQQNYPMYKYIQEEQVGEICRKYGLVMGEVNRYIGEVPKKNIEEIAKFKKDGIKEEDRKYLTTTWVGTKECSYKEYIHRQAVSSAVWSNYRVYEWMEDNKYKICAPISDMNMEGAQIKGHKIMDIPDPVVLYPVREGYLIISAWGPEASDESVVNHKMN